MADESVTVSNSASSSNPDYSVAVDTVAGKEYQIVKLDIGADGATSRVTDLATSANQDTGNASLSSIDGKLTTLNAKDFATSAKQDTGNTSLASIDSKTPSLGQALSAASVPVVLPASQITTLTPPAAITNYALETGGNLATLAGGVTSNKYQTNTAQINGVAPSMGNGISGTGVQRVTIASDSTGQVTLAAGSQTIGKLGSNSGVTIGAVEIAAAQTLSTVTTVGTITNNVNTVEVAPTTIFNGKTTVTTAGTRVTLAASQAVKSVTIKALSTNTGLIYVGNSSVASTNGYQLAAGDTISLDISNLNTVNIDSAVNGEGVSYLGVN